MAKEIRCTINGVDYPVLFTMGTMLRFKRLTGKEITQMDSNSLEDAAMLIFCAVQSGAKANGMEFTYDAETFFDAMSMEDFGELSQAVIQMYQAPIEGVTATTKKKTVKKK